RIFSVSRSEMTTEGYVRELETQTRDTHLKENVDAEAWTRFVKRVHYIGLDALAPDGPWNSLRELLGTGEGRIRVFYLATGSDLFGPICEQLAAHGLVTPNARVVLEKPIGHDLAEAQTINDAVGKVFAESQIFRIDHYLGKETVQNLMVLRFANSLFELMWSSANLEHVQITVAEKLGVGARGGYYDQSGAMRDMVQNHLLQLLCLVAMEPPSSYDADQVRDEKIKVMRALRIIEGREVVDRTVTGQYRAGTVDGKAVPGYLEDLGRVHSDTETYVAIKAEIANWRWAGVPIYLRTGKRLADRWSEIVIQFRPVPHVIFDRRAGDMASNRLVIRLQPDEGVRLHLMTKEPGPGGLRLRQVPLNLSYAEAFKVRYPDAYERLLMDVVRGNTTLFMRRDEVEAAWRWTEPVLAGWREYGVTPRPYAAGTMGPTGAAVLLGRDGRSWVDQDF
ncbi:MAG: glucose-6-phosphate dehydrogenase, partial [Myxococcota bacterium]